jgi:hypothetical protein
MQGKTVVGIMGVIFIATTALFWGVGLTIQAEVQQQAESHGVPKLTQQEAATRVAREDKFGLPSRLEDAPSRDIEAPWKYGTPDNPFPATADGIRELFKTYAVSIKGCRSQLPKPEKDVQSHVAYITLEDIGGFGRVREVHIGTGDPAKTRRFTTCLAGGFLGAHFERPEDDQVTLSSNMVMPE